MKKYELTAEHRAQLPAWRDKWIANAMSTVAMTDEDKSACRKAVLGLYAAAKLPAPKHIVFVPSPFVLRFAGGFAAAIWWLAKNKGAATGDATEDATEAATEAATRDATEAATEAATGDATEAATRDATRDATEDATWTATWTATGDATGAATMAATWAATRDATRDATEAATGDATENDVKDDNCLWCTNIFATMARLARAIGHSNASFLLSCASNANQMWNGGNQWSGWPSALSFFRHIVALKIDYSAWDHYEVLAERSGPRIMHPDFCMISDRPKVLIVDGANRPHNDNGPFCQWRDGTALYSVHGVRVPEWLITQPTRLTVAAIQAETNEEVRRVMIERYGVSSYVRNAQFEIVHSDVDSVGNRRRLLRNGETLVIELVNSTEDADGSRRIYHVPCHPELRPLLSETELGEPQELTALNAVASTYGMRGEQYQLEAET